MNKNGSSTFKFEISTNSWLIFTININNDEEMNLFKKKKVVSSQKIVEPFWLHRRPLRWRIIGQ